eukprot:bmy_20281T0
MAVNRSSFELALRKWVRSLHKAPRGEARGGEGAPAGRDHSVRGSGWHGGCPQRETFNQLEIKPEMIHCYLSEYSITYRPMDHSWLGIRVTHSFPFIPFNVADFMMLLNKP